MTNRYDKASDAARKLLENFDEFDLAEMLASSKSSAATLNARITELEQYANELSAMRNAANERARKVEQGATGMASAAAHLAILMAERAEQAEAAIERVRALHHEWKRNETDPSPGYCAHCEKGDDLLPWPCPTLAALDQPRQPPEQQRSPAGLPAEQPCADPRHTGALREQLGCSGPDPATT
ncbi:hypothetical protein [Streptomyces sp. NPDC056707]|uniref:hypothetical protein n=1 Tax=Streptomyces sp. NPDC056707 TaxID=3345919 RepID=UPI0036B01DC1